MAAAAAPVERAEAPLPGFDLERVRADFPILARRVHGRPLVYLDNAATTQKPRAVLAAIARVYEESCSNVARGVHTLSGEATALYEGARATVARFLGAADPSEVVFVRGTTEAINLMAGAWGRARVGEGDEVLVTGLEHHSNLVPWQMLCAEKGARLVVAPLDDRGDVIVEELERRLSPRTRIAAVAHVSNALGTVNPVRRIADLAHAVGATVVVDGAQGAPHLPVDVAALGCDAYAFSGHKIYGPSGIGVLWARRELLAAMPPYQGGGGMITSVTFEDTEFGDPPHRFEAGTPAIEAAVGLAAALDYLEGIGRERAAAWEKALLDEAVARLADLPAVTLIGTPRERASVVSFALAGAHPHDVGTVLDRRGIAVRAGHHCAQPVMERFGVPATTRASFAFYNRRDEVDALIDGVRAAAELFA
ncbi:MAG TPA: cysteine desulfurase [Thermoanaerobaculia bacterium]|nr:cysteine desulfurase [Thermoanaerobaculia bacterium]